MLTQKINNNEYAPGIATYGINGQKGDQGQSGTSVFFTNYDVQLSDDFLSFVGRIQSNMLPLKNKSEKLERKYIEGDYFFDLLGNFYQLQNIDSLLSLSEDQIQQSYFHNYLVLKGRTNTNTNEFFVKNMKGRLMMNSSCNGVDITINDRDNFSADTDTDAALRILSDNADDNGKVLFIELDTLYGDSNIAKMELYYDNNLKAFHFSSDQPILFDSPIKVSSASQTQDFDEYSSVITTDTPITGFYNFCNLLDSSLINASRKNSSVFQICINKLSESQMTYFEGIRKSLMTKIVYADSSGNLQTKLYTSKDGLFDDDKLIKDYYNSYYKIDVPFIGSYANLSLIYNIEVYLA